MSLRYEIKDTLVRIPVDKEYDGSCPIVEVLTKEDFLNLDEEIEIIVRDKLAFLAEAESCYVDVFPKFIIGSMAVPNKEDLMGDRKLFSYYWEPNRLIFIDQGDLASTTMERVANSELDVKMTTALCLYSFFHELVLGDPTWLGNLEDEMEDAEDALLDSKRDVTNYDLARYRRITVRLSTYYKQLADVALELSGNANRLMTGDEAQKFESIINTADRLESRADTIREYSLTLRELHQTQIDLAQNKTMQLLTIVTVIIAPLTLIAGWFGMNFSNMPGVNTPYGFYIVSIIGLIITVLLILRFHRKHWL